MTTKKPRRNVYKGSMGVFEAERKLSRIAERLTLGAIKLGTAPTANGAPAARITFTSNGTIVQRVCDTQQSYEANVACLTLWLEDRARNMERDIETFAEAFADSMTLAVVGAETRECRITTRSRYEGSKSVNDSVAVFRACLKRLGIAEQDVKVTWHETENWARIRMRLPSGAIVEKTSTAQTDFRTNLAALALWLQSRTKNWERGIESVDLERVFAGNLLPARVA